MYKAKSQVSGRVCLSESMSHLYQHSTIITAICEDGTVKFDLREVGIHIKITRN